MEWLSASTTRVAFPGWEFGGTTVIEPLFCSHIREHHVRSKDRAARLHAIEEAMMRGEERELDPARGPNLVEDVRQVRLDRVLADGQPLADLFVGAPAHNHPHDFELTRRQAK